MGQTDNIVEIGDWDDAYANRDHIENAESFIDNWQVDAENFRHKCSGETGAVEFDVAYGENSRERLDIFFPVANPKGLFVFVHGGYWMAFDKSYWSHLARKALDEGWVVAIPSYRLCPDVKIDDITRQIGKAVELVAQKVEGPIILAGHSAGGHLVSRLGCQNTVLGTRVIARILRIISISGVHDLRPLLRLQLNETLGLDEAQAKAESPALLLPIEGIEIDCVVGGDERPEFIRQNVLLANIWIGLGARTREIIVEGKHHFNIIEELSDGNQGWLDLTHGRQI